MKAIIIGATGLTGSKILKNLLDNTSFEEVVSFQRASSNINHPKLKIITTEMQDVESLRDKIRGDVLFNAMGTTIKKAGSKKEQQRIDRDIPIAFAKIASENGVKLMLNISSIGASHSGGFYLKTKAEMEEGTSIAMKGRVINFRPSLLTGKRRDDDFRFAEKISSAIMKIINPLLIGTASRYKSICTDNLAKAMVNASLHPQDLQKTLYYNDIVHLQK